MRQSGSSIVFGLVLALAVTSLAGAQAYAQAPQQAAGTQQPAAQTPPKPATVFAGDAGLILNYIKADKIADFEMVMGKVREALQKSEKPERKQQAESWKIFKSPDPAGEGTVLYVFVIDPAVAQADYTVGYILAEAFPPQEVQDLYTKFKDAYTKGQVRINLSSVK